MTSASCASEAIAGRGPGRMGMWVAVLVITSVLLLPLGGSESAMVAAGPRRLTSASLAARGAKDAPRRAPRKPVAGPPKKKKAAPHLGRATRPAPRCPRLSLLVTFTARDKP